jgi:hypothetical protein
VQDWRVNSLSDNRSYIIIDGQKTYFAPHKYALRVNLLVRKYKPNHPLVPVVVDNRVKVPATTEHDVDIGPVKHTSVIRLGPSFFELSESSRDITLKHEVAHIIAGKPHSKEFWKLENKIVGSTPVTIVYWKGKTPVVIGTAKSVGEAQKSQKAMQYVKRGYKVSILHSPPDLALRAKHEVVRDPKPRPRPRPAFNPYAFLNFQVPKDPYTFLRKKKRNPLGFLDY